VTVLPRGRTVRKDAGLYGYERALARAGLVCVAGADEAGRGACAGPLVAAAVVLDPARPIRGLADSKLLTPARRDACFDVICEDARSVSAVVIESREVDRLGVQRANIEALRRAVARLDCQPDFVLTDGFGVDGLGAPGLAVWKGDQVAASIAAASVVAKVTRDRIMVSLHESYPAYDFATHKGYVTAVHQAALSEHGPCPEHRFSYVNVREAQEGKSDEL